MNKRMKVFAVVICCGYGGLACSKSDPVTSNNGGANGGSQTGGSSGISQTGGSVSGGPVDALEAGSGGSVVSSSGGKLTGGMAGNSSGGIASTSGGIASTGGSGGMSQGGVSALGGSTSPKSGGSTGTGGRISTPVVPTIVSESSRGRFAFGDVIFEVDPKVGARVAKFSFSGADMVVSSGSDTTGWGGVFWTSPQSAWDAFWPPPKAIDSNPYTGGISQNHFVLESGSYAALGVSVTKDFSADSTTGWVTIAYTIKATKEVKAAPWENCRVPRGGLAFFPAGTSLSKGPLTMTEAASTVWFDDTTKSATSKSGEKAIADGSGGWLAYVLDGNLFIRKFTDTLASAQAPNEGEAEIYPGSGFLELEIQGPYTSIPAGGNLTWTVAWHLVKVPTSVTVSAGSPTLLEFTKQVLNTQSEKL